MAGNTATAGASVASRLLAVLGAFDAAFTQYAGEDMYHPHLGGFNHYWVGDETAP